MIPTKVKGIVPIAYEVRNPSGDWSLSFGDIITEPQKFGQFDTDSCWNASPCKGTIEIQINFLLSQNAFTPAGVVFLQQYRDASGYVKISEQFPEILGKNMDNGGTAVEAEQLFQQYGCIPWSMLHYSDEQAAQWTTQAEFDADYFNPKAVTIQMITLGRQFLQFVNIAFQRIGVEGTTPALEILQAALKQAPLQYGVAIDTNVAKWNETVVPAPNNSNMAHEITGYRVNADGSYGIVDNYSPWIKTLSSNYPLLAVIQGIVTAIPENPPTILQNQSNDNFWTSVMNFFNGIFNRIPVGKVV